MEKRILNVTSFIAWGGASSKTLNFDVPFLVKKIVVKPLLYNFQDTGLAAAAYPHAAIYSNITGTEEIIGAVISGVYSTGGAPLLGYTFQFPNPIRVSGIKNFRSVAVQDQTALVLANGMLLAFEFHEA